LFFDVEATNATINRHNGTRREIYFKLNLRICVIFQLWRSRSGQWQKQFSEDAGLLLSAVCVVVASPFCIVIIQNDSISTFETAPRARDSGRGPLFFFHITHTQAMPRTEKYLSAAFEMPTHRAHITVNTSNYPNNFFLFSLIVIQMLVGGGARSDVILF
jgi:hypothetical protein